MNLERIWNISLSPTPRSDHSHPPDFPSGYRGRGNLRFRRVKPRVSIWHQSRNTCVHISGQRLRKRTRENPNPRGGITGVSKDSDKDNDGWGNITLMNKDTDTGWISTQNFYPYYRKGTNIGVRVAPELLTRSLCREKLELIMSSRGVKRKRIHFVLWQYGRL